MSCIENIFSQTPNPGFTTRQSQSASSSFARLAQLIRTETNLNNWILSLEPGWPRRVDRYYWYWIEGYIGNWLSTELKSWDIGVEIASDLWSVQHEFESQFSCVDFKQNTQFLPWFRFLWPWRKTISLKFGVLWKRRI